MTHRHPAQVGMSIEEIETPALIVDLDTVERNLKTLADALDGTGVVHRAHAKMHKCPALAKLQIAQGAVGVCCQKVSEAEAMVEGGIDNVLVTNEIVDPRKIERLADLATRASVAVCVDNPLNVPVLNEAAHKFGIMLPVLVEINVGANRAGVEPGRAALELAQAVDSMDGLRFAGLQAYHGSAQHKRKPEERKAAIDGAVAATRQTRDLLMQHGLACDMITGGGTGTYRHEAASDLYTEIQAGSYVFMDADYAKNIGDNGKPFAEFEHALFIYATVMSTSIPGQALIDLGHKAQSSDSGPPVVYDMPGAEFVKASDEHGVLKLSESAPNLIIGDKIKLIPGHIDPTCNLHEYYVVLRGDIVEALWPITAKGPGL
jgi:3-hydroxy-D-aspartate aldolase